VDVRVLREFTPDDVAAVRRLARAVEHETGTSPFGESTWTGLEPAGAHDATRADIGLFPAEAVAGLPDGYAHLTRHHDEEWQLEVAARPGVADDERVRLALAALDEVADAGGGHVTLWFHAASEADNAVAQASGFALERELLQMRVPLPLDAPPEWPAQFSVRTFEVGRDEAAWVVVNNRAFAGHPEQGGWTVPMLEARETEPWFDPERFLLAFDDDDLAGFCWTKVHPADPPRELLALGEIYVIGVDPGRQGTGLGRALTAGGLDVMARGGVTMGMLFVDGANAPAVALYESLGFHTHRTDRAYGRRVDRS
jgi:mycothiol synthase